MSKLHQIFGTCCLLLGHFLAAMRYVVCYVSPTHFRFVDNVIMPESNSDDHLLRGRIFSATHQGPAQGAKSDAHVASFYSNNDMFILEHTVALTR